MEEIYIVKLKGLPPPSIPSQDSLSKDSKTSFYYHTDLTAEAIRGFSYLHIFFGITVLCLSVTNLCFHDNPLSLEPPLGITVWCSIAFILLGFFGILTAYKRKCDLSGSIFYVKFQLVLIVIVLSLTLTFAILFMLDLHGPIANQFIGLNILFSIIVETVILLLTLFTCARVLWPGCINFCAKDWPMQPSLKRKMIVKTNVFTNGIQQDKASIIQSFGPNCVISLNMPPASTASNGGTSSAASESALSSKNSSICSSPTYKISSSSQRNNKTTCSLSGSTSDLAKSLSTIYAMPDESIMQQALENSQPQEQIATIATNSIYYNYPSVAVSTTNLLQTFPNADQQNREQSSSNSNNHHHLPLSQQQQQQPQKLSSQHCSSIFQHDSSTNNSSDHSWYRGSSGDSYSAAESEEIDPYDTDEFDYCSSTTEDEQDDNQMMMDNHDECHKSSSDDGNGTLEEDSKSITNSESSHTPSTASELVTSDEGGSYSSPRKQQQQPQKKHYSAMTSTNSIDHNQHDDELPSPKAQLNDDINNVVCIDPEEQQQQSATNKKSTQIEIKQQQHSDNKLKLKLYSIKKAIETLENKTNNKMMEYNEEDDDDDEEMDNGEVQTDQPDHQQQHPKQNVINSNTSENERSSINQIELRSTFATTATTNNAANKTSPTQAQSYKPSIIKIESPTNATTTKTVASDDKPSKTSMQQVSLSEQKSNNTNTSTTTIRLLNTNKTSSNTNNKFNSNSKTLHNIEHQHNHQSPIDNQSESNSMAKISKLSSHPYLCRMRAAAAASSTPTTTTTTDQCFERRYPKQHYLVSCSTNDTNSLSSTASSPSSESPSPTLTTKPNFLTIPNKPVNLIESHNHHQSHHHHHHHRIPDIQRV